MKYEVSLAKFREWTIQQSQYAKGVQKRLLYRGVLAVGGNGIWTRIGVEGWFIGKYWIGGKDEE